MVRSLSPEKLASLRKVDVPLPIAMLRMRHSDPKLTANAYVDQGSLPVAGSIAKLPGMPNGNQWSPDSSLESVVSGQNVSKPVAVEPPLPESQTTLKLVSRFLSHLGAITQMAPAVGIEPTT
jgi:hypothetical protein